jgi:4-hydroxymandelate oxidase
VDPSISAALGRFALNPKMRLHTPTRRQVIVGLTSGLLGASLSTLRVFAEAAPSKSGQSFRPLCLDDYETLARERMPKPNWEFINSGSADELTLKWNRKALAKIRLQPRVLVDVSRVDTSISIAGQRLVHPIMIAPTAAHMLAHPDGEAATAKGGTAAGAVFVASTLSNRSIEEVSAAASGPIWFQLYVEEDRGLTKEMIARAEAAGCRAICITVDLSVAYGRNRVARVDEETPSLPFPNMRVDSARPGRARAGRRNPKFNWKDLEWLKAAAKTPIFLKGILSPNDAETAVQAGVAGIMVSNHGGRGLDSIPATIDALPRVVDRVANRAPVIVDGGIRRGTDVLKALAFGANAVMIGRPSIYGVAVNGADGVKHVVEILRAELEAAMALTGRTKIDEIDRTVLWPA